MRDTGNRAAARRARRSGSPHRGYRPRLTCQREHLGRSGSGICGRSGHVLDQGRRRGRAASQRGAWPAGPHRGIRGDVPAAADVPGSHVWRDFAARSHPSEAEFEYRRRVRGIVLIASAAMLSTAPFQCKGDDPARAREETPGEALWQLCGRFAAKGDDASARATLDYLIERYPSSREAERAKSEREAAHPCSGVALPASVSGPASAPASASGS